MLTVGVLVEYLRVGEIAETKGLSAVKGVLVCGRDIFVLSQVDIGPMYPIVKLADNSITNAFALFRIDMFVDVKI